MNILANWVFSEEIKHYLLVDYWRLIFCDQRHVSSPVYDL